MSAVSRTKRQSIKQLTALSAFAFAGVIATGSAIAQQFPSKPITVVVPFATGGFNDRMARAFAPFLQKQLGQPVTIVNRGGAGAQLGHAYLLANRPMATQSP